jgi:rhamnosyltransferase
MKALPVATGQGRYSFDKEQIPPIAAAVITFNPDVKRLAQCLESICGQVNSVYVIDNASENRLEVEAVALNWHNCTYHQNGQNIGIARAINKALAFAQNEGHLLLLTLDQDSVCPRGMIAEMLPGFGEDGVGIVCPFIVDVRRSMEGPSSSLPRFERVDSAITSGSLCSIDALRDVGGCDENLFVGCVDDDLSRSLIERGWAILRANRVVLDHELGELTPSHLHDTWLKLYRATGADIFRRASYKREVSPFRTYHAIRALVYMNRKFAGGYPSKRAIAKAFIMSVVRARHKFAILEQAIRGLHDGLTVSLPGKQEG